MKIHDGFDQGSLRWMNLHLGRPTASGFDNIMTTDFEPRKGQMPETYMYKRLAEKIKGKALPGFTSYSVEQGQILEDEALPYFEIQTDLVTRRVAFVETDDGRAGCSPDALIGDNAGLEIKCPFAETHLKYLDYGVLPSDYAAQVHGSLWVTGRERWHFMSYHRGLPHFHTIVERDEEIMQKIGDCLAKFYEKFDAALQRLTNRA
jgi:YqaJ-like recombinase protein